MWNKNVSRGVNISEENKEYKGMELKQEPFVIKFNFL